ncbi:cupin domain-containing protein [Streptomyces agglomeratus]|uniref:cupin domain-containing protein n=1 Tax=Streptomyces agglomeratus TaxID=285458 RepID=UPI00159EFE91|nr:cupin domain-containing protein [Streptomyces agglomeratus]
MSRGPGGQRTHFHKTISESFFILDGTERLFNGVDWVDAKKGDFLFVPQGGLHAFRNDSDAPAEMLMLFAPGAPPREEYAEGLSQLANATDEERTEFFIKHDSYFVEQGRPPKSAPAAPVREPVARTASRTGEPRARLLSTETAAVTRAAQREPGPQPSRGRAYPERASAGPGRFGAGGRAMDDPHPIAASCAAPGRPRCRCSALRRQRRGPGTLASRPMGALSLHRGCGRLKASRSSGFGPVQIVAGLPMRPVMWSQVVKRALISKRWRLAVMR